MRSNVNALPYMQISNDDDDNDDSNNNDDNDWMMMMIGKPSHNAFSHIISYFLISSSNCINITHNTR